ncbi:MAG: PPOX class F420-dependent oxidoreductase [Chloroflexi bacterium]|nr:PPOX class F420-dependent oxidoreductase [Chloroflexota bacterium]
MTPEQIEDYLSKPHIADLATVRPDGSPHVAPVWFLYEDGVVKVLAETSSVKVKNLKNEPRVSVSIATDQQPYEYVIVNGVAEVSGGDISDILRRISVHYQGPEEGERYAEKTLRELVLCLITIRPSKLIGWSGEG